MLFGALEAGGTKMVCAIGNEHGEILEQVSFPTLTPEETLPQIVAYFQDKEIAALGIACFGPVDLNKASKTYGFITSTPKIAWQNVDMVGTFHKALGVPVGFDTDVNGSLLGEVTWGCAQGLTDAVYLTIGTGIGGGVMTNGKLLHGMMHPELGHIRMVLHKDDKYAGHCPYHGTCLEGLACGPAIEARWGKKAVELADEPKVWEIESYYLAQALVSCIFLLSPQKIILGGGVMHQEHLFPLIRENVKALLNDYLHTAELADLDNYIVPASLNDDQGIMGCIKLAMNAYEEQ